MRSKLVNLNWVDRTAQILICFEIIYCSIIGFIVNDLNFPGYLKYVSDIINICLLFCLILKLIYDLGEIKKSFIQFIKRKMLFFIPLLLAFSFLAICIISSVINKTNFLLFLWALRNTFRFFIFFISCIVFDSNKIFETIRKFLFLLLILDFVLLLYQFIFTDLSVDQINGIFGQAYGNNNASNAFYCVILILLFTEMFKNNRLDFKSVLFILFLFFFSIISELKIFFIEFLLLVILFLVFIFNKINLKKFLKFGLIFLLFMSISMQLLYKFNPGFNGFFNEPKQFIEYVYSEPYWSSTAKEVLVTETNRLAKPINRFSFIEIINDSFFDTTQKKLLGLGFGNCDYSSYSFLKSDNYIKYNFINYTWFSSSFVFIETGWIGLLLYFSFFLSLFLVPLYYFFKNKSCLDRDIISSCTGFICLIFLFYGVSLRSELSAYLVFYMLSLTFDTYNQSPVNNQIRIQKENDLISIIIPVYNVEKYLNYCLTSVINQSYSNLEIVIVNDGSSDNSLEICNKFKTIDSRIKIISQKNKGLSAARNTGIKYSSGRYIFFLDSDDALELSTISKLYYLSKKYNSSIVGCDMKYIYNVELPTRFTEYPIIENFRGIDVIKTCLDYNVFNIMACGKLFDKKLFDNISFPEGLLNEDEYTIPYIFEKSNSATHTTEKLYKYTQRRGSIMNSSYSLKKLAILNTQESRLNYFRKLNDSNLDTIILYHYFVCICNQLFQIKSCDFKIDKNIYDKIIIKKREIKNEIFNSSNVSIMRKLKIMVYDHFYCIFKLIKR